jgi:hypothetical protein
MRKTDRFGVAVVTLAALAMLAVLAPRGAEAQETAILIGDATGQEGGTATVNVGLATGTAVAGTENEIGFVADAQIAFNDSGEPECTVNPSIGKSGYFAFQPTGCTPGDDCTSVKAIIIGIFESTQEECDANPDQCYNLDPIPDGSRLYSCELSLGADGRYPLTCTNPDASDPDGVPIDTDCPNAEVTVEPGVGACIGDCNGNGEVTLGEVQTALDIFFEDRPFSECPNADGNDSGDVSLGEVQTALDNFFEECPQ